MRTGAVLPATKEPDVLEDALLSVGLLIVVAKLAEGIFQRLRLTWSDTRLGTVARQSTPNKWPDERVEDALQRMTESSLTVLPVMKRESRDLVGAITSHESLELITAEARGGS